MKTRPLLLDSHASAVPLILFVVTIVVVGALYTLFFTEIGLNLVDNGNITVSSSPYKTFMLTAMRGIPVIVLVVGIVSLMIAGLKRNWGYIS